MADNTRALVHERARESWLHSSISSEFGAWPESEPAACVNSYCNQPDDRGRSRVSCTFQHGHLWKFVITSRLSTKFRLLIPDHAELQSVRLLFNDTIVWRASGRELWFLNRAAMEPCPACSSLLQWSNTISLLLRRRMAALPRSIVLNRIWRWHFQTNDCDCDATLPSHLQRLRSKSVRCLQIPWFFNRHGFSNPSFIRAELQVFIEGVRQADKVQLACVEIPWWLHREELTIETTWLSPCFEGSLYMRDGGDQRVNLSITGPIATCLVFLQTEDVRLDHSFERLSLYIVCGETQTDEVLYASFTAEEAHYRNAPDGMRAYCIPLSTSLARYKNLLFPLEGPLVPGSYLHVSRIRGFRLLISGVRRDFFVLHHFTWTVNLYRERNGFAGLAFI